MAADEFNTMSATLRFPFQASLDGINMVETDGNFYYGLDTAQAISELPAAESESIIVEAPADEMSYFSPQHQEPYKQPPPVTFHNPRWDSLLKDDDQGETPDVTTSRPVSLMPHRIYTSDQQRFATEHEMTAEQTQETGEIEDDQIYCESPTSTIEPTEKTETIEPPAQNPARRGAPPRFYSTPIDESDPNSTPVLLYGLEQPLDLKIRHKKLVSSRSRSYYSAGPVRPSSRHGPSSLSSSIQPGIPEDTESSTPSRRLSVLFRRSSTYIPNVIAGPSTYSSGSASTISTVRSIATAVTEDSNYASNSTIPDSSTSSSPTLHAIAPPKQKPVSNASPPSLVQENTTTTTTPLEGDDKQPDVSSAPPPSPPRPIRRTNLDLISDNVSSGESSRRNSIFNFSLPKFAPLANRSFMRSSEALGTTPGEDIRFNNDFPLIRAPSKPMPYSPDSFASPHTEAGRGRPRYRTTPISNNDNTNNNDDYNNSDNEPTTPRPHTSHNPAMASSSSFSARPRMRTFSISSRKLVPSEPLPQSQLQHSEQTGKEKDAPTAGSNRVTRFLTRVFG